MKCYKHPDRDAVGVCVGCGNAVCRECNVRLGKENCCRECKDKLSAAVGERRETAKGSRWPIGLLIGCGGFVVLVIAVVAAMLLPALARARESARRAVCLSNVRQIGQALKMYSIDNDDRFADSLGQLNKYGLAGTSVLVCPSAPQGQKISYILTPGLSEDVDDPSKIILVRGKVENHSFEGTNVFFVDGHAKYVSPERLEELLDLAKEEAKEKDLEEHEIPIPVEGR